MNNKISLVTGANGHLGNALVRALLANGQTVRAGVRRLEDHRPFQGLDCERVPLELMDAASLQRALTDVNVLYQVAAVFRHWAPDPEQDIVRPNVEGTRLILQAAAAAGVRKVVYVSSVAAVGHDGSTRDESHWNEETDNPYYRSKIVSERAAWQTAHQLGLPLVTVLPGTMVGPYVHRLTDTMKFLDTVRAGKVPLDPDFHFNFVDVRDVASAMIEAAKRGRPGERYILANRHSSSLVDMLQALGNGRRAPPKAPRALLMLLAGMQEMLARFTGSTPELLRSQVRLFHGVRQEFNITKAERELGYSPRPPAEALAAGFAWLASDRLTMPAPSNSHHHDPRPPDPAH